MIRVQRQPPSPQVVNALNKRCGTSGLTELETGLWFYGNVAPDHLEPLPAKPDKAPEFEAYRNDHVKAALTAMFDKHCAYCESFYDHVTPMDVEHYRPKGAVIEDNGTKSKPGYYWLAAVWDNLLPSCPGCNRSRRQEQEEPDNVPYEATSGKANLFPLAQGCARATAQGLEAHEQPMLLNPCDDDPEPHLLFRADGFVEPRPSAAEQALSRGMATIKVCGLYRATLKEERRKAGSQLTGAMREVLKCDRNLRKDPDDEDHADDLVEAEAALQRVVDDIDYRALARELIALFDRVRANVSTYFAAEGQWRESQSDANQRVLEESARTLITLHAEAGLHQDFVHALYRVAKIPVDRLTGPAASEADNAGGSE